MVLTIFPMQIAFEALLREQTVDIANLLLSMIKPHILGGPPMLEYFVAWDSSINCTATNLCITLMQDSDCSVVAKALEFIR